MIYITGDMHGDRNRFKEVSRAGIRKGDTLIICGDFGFLWNGGDKEKKVLKWIGKRRYQVLFVDGCNENHTLLAQYPVTELMGGRVRQISGRLYSLCRGEVYDIGGKSVFAFGGGDASERYSRNSDDELLLPSQEELDAARDNLKRRDYKVDYIVTHDAPAKLRQFIDMSRHDEPTTLHVFLEKVAENVTFRRWYFGKYHTTRVVPPHYQMVFKAVLKCD